MEVAWGAHTQIVPWAQSFPPIWHIVDANGDNVLSNYEAKVAIVGRVTSLMHYFIVSSGGGSLITPNSI